jgi:hypothetical protein
MTARGTGIPAAAVEDAAAVVVVVMGTEASSVALPAQRNPGTII